jgi:hypothetical protein
MMLFADLIRKVAVELTTNDADADLMQGERPSSHGE